MQDNDLNIEDFKEIFLKAPFANDDLNPTATIEEMADYFELESFKFMKKNSDDSLNQKLKDLVFKKFINWIEKAKLEVSEPFIEYEQRRLFNIWQLQGQGTDVSEIEKPSRYNLSIPISNVSKRLGGRLELWVVDSVYKGFEMFKQQHEENNNVVPSNDNRWIRDIVKEEYKKYGFVEQIGLDYNEPFLENDKGDVIKFNKKWASVSWYIKNLNKEHVELLNNLEILPKQEAKEQILFERNKQTDVFQDWSLRKGDYLKYFNSKKNESILKNSIISEVYL